MKEQKQIFKELLILIFMSSITTLLVMSLVYAYSIPKGIDDINNKLDQIDKNIEELEEDINQIQFEKSFERTCQLEVIDCEFEWKAKALVSATFRLETGNGKSEVWLQNNNAGGIKCGNEYCSYQTKEQGYKALETLINQYIKKHGFDLSAIRYEYCGSHCGIEDLIEFEKIYQEELNNET